MARPKPTEETDNIMVRPPMSVSIRLRELAAKSNDGMGMALSKYALAVLEEAARLGITITEQTEYRLSNRGGFFSQTDGLMREDPSDSETTESDDPPNAD